MKTALGFICILGILILTMNEHAFSQDQNAVIAKKTEDFKVDGMGGANNWNQTDWINIPQRSFKGKAFSTKAKVLFSQKGIYFLFDCEDKKLSATMDADFLDLWKEDVVEVFLWPDDRDPVYFEYELSPLNYELPILISNHNMDLARWMPFHYEDNRKTHHGTSIKGGKKEPNASIDGWIAEFFIPYELMRPLKNIYPKSGTEWRINLYRVDYDSGSGDAWSWQLTSGSFHQIKVFGKLIFE